MSDDIKIPSRLDQRNPVTRDAFRRQVWYQIYLPLALGVVFLAAVAFGLWKVGTAGASAWADASTIVLILPVLAIGLFPLVLAIAAIYLVQVLMGAIPGPAHRAQIALEEISRRADRASELAVRPWVAAQGVRKAARRGVDRLFSVFQRQA